MLAVICGFGSARSDLDLPAIAISPSQSVVTSTALNSNSGLDTATAPQRTSALEKASVGTTNIDLP